ncbi:hypothetical protein ACHFJ0_04800 [Paracoccus sp. NGMCC 1.201697]|uniref:Alpha/beta hydrolase n=1 Tax=Paracoccus broussonetiae subsp. drimophilus TaxID=3373869 RepID=A0ABW7LID8_9RHOB
MTQTHHHHEPPSYCQIGRSTLARYPGDPLPAWLGPTKPAPTIRYSHGNIPMPQNDHSMRMLADGWSWNGLHWFKQRISAPVPVLVFGETPTLPDYEDRT